MLEAFRAAGVTHLVLPVESGSEKVLLKQMKKPLKFRISERVRLQANLDAYNAFNSSAIQTVQTTFGPNWLSPLTILDARLFQVSGQLTF